MDMVHQRQLFAQHFTYIKYNEDKNGTVPIGYPLKNNDIFILNFLGYLQPISFPGEICITGASVCNGYLNNPEKTKDAFTTISKLSQNLIYKTGDIGYWEKDGYISFIGRKRFTNKNIVDIESN